MKQRKVLGGIALVGLLGFAYAFGPEGRISQTQWSTPGAIAFAVAICGALFMAFHDRRNWPEKVWDFNPMRGLLYFLCGWFLFPVLLIVRWGWRDLDYSLGELALGTLFMSAIVGAVGTFTEHTGI